MFNHFTKHTFMALGIIGVSMAGTAWSSEEIALHHAYSDQVSQEFSQLATPPELNAYVKTALLNNAGLHAAFNRWKASLEKTAQVTALPNPELSWMYFIEEIQTRTGPQEYRVNLSQKIPWKGKRATKGKTAEAQADSHWWNVETIRLIIIKGVKTHYYDYAYLSQEVRIVKENLTLMKSLEPIIQRQVQLGASQADLIRLQVEIGKLENELARLEDYRPTIQSRLSAILNEPVTKEYPWPQPLQHQDIEVSRESLRTRTEQTNPTLKQIKHQREAARSMEESARLEKYPNFMFGLSYMNTSGASPNAMGATPSDSGDDPLAFTIGISIPIWKKKIKAGQQEARYRRASVDKALFQKTSDVKADLEASIYSLEDSARQIAFYEGTLIPRAEQALELTEIAYESGKSGILDVIDSLRDVLVFELSYWRFVTNYQKALASIEALTGGELQ